MTISDHPPIMDCWCAIMMFTLATLIQGGHSYSTGGWLTMHLPFGHKNSTVADALAASCVIPQRPGRSIIHQYRQQRVLTHNIDH